MSNATKFDQFKFDVLPFDTDILESPTTRTPNTNVGLKYDIAIDGIGYRLAQNEEIKRKKSAQPSFVDIQNQGARDDNTLDAFWWNEVFTQFQLGEGQKHKVSAERYWAATGIDIGEKKEFKLLKAVSLVEDAAGSASASSSPSASPSTSPSSSVSASSSPSTSPSTSPSASPSASPSSSVSASSSPSPSSSPSSSPSTSVSASTSPSASPSTSLSSSPSTSPSSSVSASTSPSTSPSTSVSASTSPSSSPSTSPSTSPSPGTVYYTTDIIAKTIGSYIYVTNTDRKTGDYTKRMCSYSTDGITFTDVSTEATSDILDLETDGSNVYGAWGSGVAKGTGIGNTNAWTAAWSATAVSKLLWHNNALLGINANQLYSFAIASGAATKIWPGDTTTNYTLTDLTAGSSGSVYFTGYSSDNSLVWEYNGTNTTVFATLPRGFIPQSIEIYLGVIYVGGHYLEASSGGRAALYSIASDGTTTEVGVLDKIDTTAGRQHSIRAMHGYKKKLYFGYDHLTGLGIYDIANTGISKYEYISLTSAANNKVTSVGWFLNKPFFTVGIASSAGGLYQEASTYLSSGNLRTSIADHGTTNKKLYSSIEVAHSALAAGEQVQIDYTLDDGTTWITAKTNSDDNTTKTIATFDTLEGYRISTRTTLTAGTGQTTTPTVYDVKIKAVPVLNNLFMWELPVLVNRRQKLIDGSLDYRTTENMLDDLEDLKAGNKVILFQDIFYAKTGRLHYVVVEDYTEMTLKLEPRKELEPIVQLKLREVRE